jgi:hypothetical protein
MLVGTDDGLTVVSGFERAMLSVPRSLFPVPSVEPDTGRVTFVGADGGLTVEPDTGRVTLVGADGGLTMEPDTVRGMLVGADGGLVGVYDTGRGTFPVPRSPFPVTPVVSDTGRVTPVGAAAAVVSGFGRAMLPVSRSPFPVPSVVSDTERDTLVGVADVAEVESGE